MDGNDFGRKHAFLTDQKDYLFFDGQLMLSILI